VGQAGPRVLDGRYRLEALIAAGGMGQVWRARDTLLGRPVAVKVLRSEYTADPTFLARFRAEAVHAASLSHPNIAAVYDYGEVADADGEHLAYLVMELVDGEPLSARLREGALGTEATLSVLRQTALALAQAHHAGLVHRDVKPGNILVEPGGRVKITDFGIAWSAGSAPITQAGQVVGTPQYVAPEQVSGRPPSPASDVYSLGLVGYECLTGHAAYQGDNPLAIALKHVQEQPEPLPAELPSGVRHLVDVAVARDPRERPPDADAFVAAIDRVRQGRPPEEDPAPTRDVRRPPVAPRRWVPAVVAAALAVAFGLGLAVLLIGRTPDPGTGNAGAVAEQSPTVVPIVLELDDHLGRPAADVARELSALGLVVQQRREVAPDAVPGTVIGLEPVGEELTAGDLVRLSVAVAAPSAPAPAPEPADGPTSAVERAQRTTAAEVPPSSSEAAPEPETPSSAAQEGSAPEGSPPETSAPETSGPETSGPETSEPETSAPETSETGTDPSGSSAPAEDGDDDEPPPSTAESGGESGGESSDSSAPAEATGAG
jgi:eukaryotic-like serine/threonine-protein kinase